jgi:phage-related protein
MTAGLPSAQKPLEWTGSSRNDLKEFPEDVQDQMGYALFLAQAGGKHEDAKPLKGSTAFKGAGVLEVVDDYDGDTCRAICTVQFAGVVYVLHAFRKKSRTGIETPQHEIDKVKRRLKAAEEHYERHYRRKAG